MRNVKVAISIVLLLTGNTYSPSAWQSTACEHGLLTFFGKSSQLKMEWQMQWLYLTSLIIQCRLFWSSHCCFEPLSWHYYTKRSLCPEKSLFQSENNPSPSLHQLHRKYGSLSLHSLNCCWVKGCLVVYMLRTTTHPIKGSAETSRVSLFHLPLQEQCIYPLFFSKVAWNLLSIPDIFYSRMFPGSWAN